MASPAPKRARHSQGEGEGEDEETIGGSGVDIDVEHRQVRTLVPVVVDGTSTSMYQVELFPDVPFVPVEWKTVTCPPQKIANIIPVISKHYPLAGLGMGHVKRIGMVNGEQRLLVAPDSVDIGCLHAEIQLIFTNEKLSVNVDRQVLPKYPPVYNSQKVEWAKECKWPLRPISRPIPLEIDISHDEWVYIERNMRLAIDRASDSGSGGRTGQSVIIVKPTSIRKVKVKGAVRPAVVDGEIVSFAVSMPCCKTKNVIPGRSRDLLAHTSLLAIEGVAERHRSLVIASAMEKEKEKEANLSNEYLCTGFDVFTTCEPCIMCAMALVHSRVKRIFFKERNAAYGGLGSVVQLQNMKSLNHRFTVYGGVCTCSE